MIEATALFTPWENFYVIVGSSGAALTGLQFVVMALVADARRKGSHETISAFGTPTIVHFCVVLATAALLSAPWHSVLAPTVILALGGVGGIGYVGVVAARTRRQKDYKPVLEDWVWHCVLPAIAYATLFAGAITMDRDDFGLFAIGATTLLLLLIGIHNAWDSVAYLAIEQNKAAPPSTDGAN
jgi:hypothetical protein